jgi:hypothetical protein
VLKGDARTEEFTSHRIDEARGKVFEAEREFGRMRIVAEEGEEVGEFHEIFVGEVFFEHGLMALVGGQCGPEAFGIGLGEAELHLAAEAGAGDAGGEVAEPLVGVGEIGEASLPEQGVALVEEVKEVHNG